MEHAFLHKLGRYLWRTLVVAIVLLAAYVGFGRLLIDAVGDYQDSILDELNRRVPFTIEAARVSGDWRSFSPELVLTGLQLHFNQQPDIAINLGEGRVRLDVWGSLMARNLQVSRLQLNALQLPLQMDTDGRLRVAGFSGGDNELGDWIQELVLNIEQLQLSDIRLAIELPDGERRSLTFDLGLQRDGSLRKLQGTLRDPTSDLSMELVASALGNPFELETLAAEAYLRAEQIQLDRLADWAPGWNPAVAASGRVQMETWLNWREGEPHLEARLSGRELNFQAPDQHWQFPLDQLGFSATVQRQDNSWTVFTRELNLARGDIELTVPNLQLDTWGDSLRLRGRDVSLAPISALLAEFGKTPPALAEALQTLNASALLARLEFSLDDLQAPDRDWHLSANFRDFNATSWRGAPGMRSGEGYISLAPGTGQVILDSQQFAMNFPTVYDHPLEYDDIHGTIDIEWGAERLTLHSGLITALGEEGMAHALFGLSVPFSATPAGIEMDLLVGLRDSEAGYRHKYLPAVLDEQLLLWLRDSLGNGAVQQGAFLWRGSLRGDAAPLRTVQLFFDVSETTLAFHPQWPTLSDLRGLVLIDDTDVSVWADTAKLYQSVLSGLSAEAWMNAGGDMQLAVSGQMRGGAADGLRLVKESPLSAITDHTFDDWSLAGELTTELALELWLSSDASPPKVAVSVKLDQARLDMQPLKLTVEDIRGEVSYQSRQGFSSRELSGVLWQQPVTATLGRAVAEGEVEAHSDAESVRIELSGKLPAAPLQEWLGLGDRQLASGLAPATAYIQFAPGSAAQLHLETGLQGLALDLPAPLAKAKHERWPLQLNLALGGGHPRWLDIKLQRRLHAALLLGPEGQLSGAHIALQDRAGTPRAGQWQLSGHTPFLEPEAWQSLVGSLQTASGTGGEADRERPVAPTIEVDDLLVETLALNTMEIGNVVLNARSWSSGAWDVAAETDWLQGELHLEPDLQRGQLSIRHIELDGMSNLGGAGAQGEEQFDLPNLAVRIDSLSYGGRPLGQLQFNVTTAGDTLRAAPLTGVIAGVQLTAEAPGEMLWQRGEGAITRLSAPLQFDDLGTVLEQLDYERILDTDSGRFDLQLEWPGAPQDFALATADGKLELDVDGGRFLDAPASTSGTLRVVSILNFAEMVRRLSLTHMFESGIPFDSVNGSVLFGHGTIVVPSIAVKGAASSFAFSGSSPLDKRTLDGELVATLPVANNLPWVAALTAGLPVAAGVYVVSKVFEQQMNRMSSAVYKVEGTWDDPQVNFSRIFDTSSRDSKAAAELNSETEGPDPNTPKR